MITKLMKNTWIERTGKRVRRVVIVAVFKVWCDLAPRIRSGEACFIEIVPRKAVKRCYKIRRQSRL